MQEIGVCWVQPHKGPVASQRHAISLDGQKTWFFLSPSPWRIFAPQHPQGGKRDIFSAGYRCNSVTTNIPIGMTPHTKEPMSNTPTTPRPEPRITLTKSNDYRTGYANSVQVRPSVWDFALIFGTLNQTAADAIEIENFQGIYLSPQQAKALFSLLGQNLAQYEANFGTISLDSPKPANASGSAPGPRPVQ